MRCKWPIGDPRIAGFHFCGAQAERTPYCEDHRALAYEPEPSPKLLTAWVDLNVKVADGRRR